MPRSRTQIAFLLAQLGSDAAERFGDQVDALDFTRPQAGLLRVLARNPGRSQRAVAAELGTPPSRLVALVDGLESAGLVQRRRSTDDRRNYELYLTDDGQDALCRIGTVAMAHEDAMTAPLTAAEREQLNGLLEKLAAAHGLRPGVHPGYRNLTADDDRRHRAGSGASSRRTQPDVAHQAASGKLE